MAKNRVQELESKLRAASSAYYGSAEPIMSDADFDRLRDELEELDPKNKFLAEVGSLVDSALTKVSHVIPMGSLKKITSVDQYNTWLNTVSKTAKDLQMAIEFKLDGLSIELVYKDGRFVKAITRGDGSVGDDVTHTLSKSKSFPNQIDAKGDTYVRCEVLLMLDDWRSSFSATKNPRNAASGLSRRLDAKGAEFLQCIAFDVLTDDHEFATEKMRIDWLAKMGFATTFCRVVSPQKVKLAVDAIADKRSSLPYEIDGVVVKINDVVEQQKLGEHDGRPYWARAWKFPAMGGHSIIRGVTWSIGTQGTINPVANIDPICVGGVTIQNVTLHNMNQIEELGIYIGDEIEVIRAGDVIPKVVRVVKKGSKRQKIEIPNCPVCGGSVRRDGPRLLCSNGTECSGAVVKKIKKWIGKREIMFLGDSNIELLLNAGIASIADLYGLTIDKMLGAGMGQRMAEKILQEIEKSRTVTLANFIGSLSIDMLGRSEAANLVKLGFDTLDKWLKITASQISILPGYQSTKAERISAGVQKSAKEIRYLSQKLNLVAQTSQVTSSKFKSQTFCFTGSMERGRKELEEMVVANGGTTAGVSKGLTYLVIADPTSNSNKAVKARSLGTKLISEKQFLDMVAK